MESIQQKKPEGWRNNYFLKAFLLGLGLSFLVFLPFIVIDGGRFLFFGDFNVQQVPFYRLAHDAVRSGNMGWSSVTDLGANFVGSYSFYLLGSPFFWLTIPFPSDWVQFLMGPLLILKFASATFTGYVFIHRYTKNQNTALIASLLYAFSGFSIYNVFFNHFHEAIVFFPLMLAALDEYIATRRRGLFALAVCACCVVNYYFFVGQVTFTLLYFILRLICKSFRISVKDFFLLVLEAVLGVGLSCVLLVPSVMAIVQNNRVSSYINGWNAVLYNQNQRYLHILECFFFPPDLPARPNFTPDSESKWASLGAWLPLFGMTGVIGWLQMRRRHWLKKFLWILFTMAMVPFLNSAFQLMNSSYYARWYYMLTLMMALATGLALEDSRIDWKRSIKWTGVITGAFAVVIGFMPTVVNQEGTETVTFGLNQYPERFWTYVAISLICLGLTCYLLLFCNHNKKLFARSTLGVLSAVCVLYSMYFIAIGKTQSDYTWKHLIPYSLNGGKELDLPDLKTVRSDFYESIDNAAMFWQIPSINAFHSIVPGSVMDFYESIGIQRDVASRPETKHYALRGLTSVKWLFDQDDDDEYFAGEDSAEPSMPGFGYYGNANGYDIWENEYFVPMGFTYEYFVPRSQYNAAGESTRELMMMRALVVEDDRIEATARLLTELPQEDRAFGEESYFQDCKNRASMSCSSFAYTRTGFAATISTQKEELVFFSVPYEQGWSAKVNGDTVPIERANVGFMAVVVPMGDQVQIEFTYNTPGLPVGALLTLLSFGILALYLVLCKKAQQRKKNRSGDANRRKMAPMKFSQYLSWRKITFLRPGAMKPAYRRESVVPLPLENRIPSPPPPLPWNASQKTILPPETIAAFEPEDVQPEEPALPPTQDNQ